MIGHRAFILGLFALCFVAVFCEKQEQSIADEFQSQLSKADVVSTYVSEGATRVRRNGGKNLPPSLSGHVNNNNNNNNDNQGGFRQRANAMDNENNAAMARARENAQREREERNRAREREQAERNRQNQRQPPRP